MIGSKYGGLLKVASRYKNKYIPATTAMSEELEVDQKKKT